MDDSFEQRGKALEEQFFRKKNQELLEKLQRELATKEHRDALAHVSGIDDDATLTALAEQGIGPETLVCVSLIPLIAVAWADGTVEPEERRAILNAAEQNHIEPGSASYTLLEQWLTERPGQELLNAWGQYMHAMKAKLDATGFAQMKSSIIKRSQQIADAAGGFLGIGKVSITEKKVLQQLESLLNQ